jgi:hypothetical protein
MQQNPSSLTPHTTHNNTNKTRAPLLSSQITKLNTKVSFDTQKPKYTHTHTHTQTKLKLKQQQQPRVAGRGNKW